jgi:hypothetical protein
MKKIAIVLTVGCISLSAFAGRMYAQQNGNVMAFTSTKAFKHSIESVILRETSIFRDSARSTELKDVNLKAITDFKNRYSAATEAKWYAIPDGYVTHCILDGFAARIFYNKKGRWQASLTNSGESKLPKDIRAIVKSTYYDFTITLVQDVETLSGGVYVIHLDDSKHIKIVRVTKEGNMDTLQEFEK